MNLDRQTITCGVGPLGFVLGAVPTDPDAATDAVTPNQIKHNLRKQGQTLKSFAKAHGFTYRTVSDVVRGIRVGNYGEGREVRLQIKAQFEAAGMPISDWAEKNGFPRDTVYRVLNGYTPCKRGLPHRIAVKLGIKPEPTKTPA